MFLPFTENGAATELQAIRVKRALGVGMYQGTDPFAVLPRIPARLVTREDFEGCPNGVADILFGGGCDGVSAIGLFRSPADGWWLIFLNANHHRHRQRTSLMEEIVHIVLDHPKTTLSLDRRGKLVGNRTFNGGVEDEAFNVGAACIIPYRDLFYAIKDRYETAEQIAERYDVSTKCVEYRIKRAGLSRVYAKQVREAARRR